MATGAARRDVPEAQPDGSGLSAGSYPIPASDYLLEIDGIKGESFDKKHKDTIEIESFSWGATNSGVRSSGGGGGAGKVVFQDFSFVKAIDKSSPLLFERATTGQHIHKAVLFVRKAGGQQQEYVKITMSDVLVSSYKTTPQTPGSNTGEVDAVSLNFAEIEYAYSPQNPDGSLGSPLVSTYDLKAQKEVASVPSRRAPLRGVSAGAGGARVVARLDLVPAPEPSIALDPVAYRARQVEHAMALPDGASQRLPDGTLPMSVTARSATARAPG